MQLQFSRDGKVVAAGDADGVTIVDVPSGTRRRIELGEVQAVAAPRDQIWVACTRGTLIRLALDGRVLGEHPLATDPDATLVAATIGPAAALWTACVPALFVDDLGSIAVLPVPTDAIAPFAGRRLLRGVRDRLVLPTGADIALVQGSRLLCASVLFDGAVVAAISKRGDGRAATLFAVSSGRAVQTVALPAGPVAVAARRGVAVVRPAHDVVVVVDLRFGQVVGSAAIDANVLEVAIDPGGELLALQTPGGVELVRLADLLAKPRQVEPEPVAERVVSDRSEPAPPQPDAQRPPRGTPPPLSSAPIVEWDHLNVSAFSPRARRSSATRVEALAELDRELGLVKLWALLAIVRAWDSRRLGYGDEGAHPYEHEVAALVGLNRGFAPEHLATARDALTHHEAALIATPTYRTAAMPLIEIADELGLTETALDILLVVAAPAFAADIARLFGILANDPGRPIIDAALVEQLLAERADRHAIAAELHPRAPLLALGVITQRAAGPFAGLEVDPVILARLRGDAPDVGGAPHARTTALSPAELDLPPAVAAQAIAALASGTTRIAVRGRAGTGRRTLLAALAGVANRKLATIDASALPRNEERFAPALALALRRAQLAGNVPVVHDLEAVVFGERTGTEIAKDVLAAHLGPVCVVVAPRTTPPLPVGHALIELPVPTETERLASWERALAPTGHWLRDAAGLAARYRVGVASIRRAVASLAGHDVQAPADDRLDAFLRQARDVRLADHARRVERLATWDDLVLPPDIMDSLRELIGRVRHRRIVFEDWGMSRMMATSRGLTALFQGQPGTGKTLVAGVIARELGLDLYQVDLSKVMSKWIGETERNLSTIFDAAEDGQVILLFDEADSLFAKRTEVRSSNDRYANLEVNYLLQRLDSFEGIAILTTNSSGSIDPAFKRRLSFRLSFPFPDEDTRAELWRTHLPPQLPRGEDLTFDALARKYQLSGGYIRNACLRAAFLAAQEETALHQRHLERAVALEFAELGKLSTSGTID